ncbi:hypothetical protein GIB67_038506 [Kingdonia uniflora]|uniref:Uncharacterized protein n=1 Tax=Kingdonia uniflora TaxID=39325 RepID=A0A7J7NPA3_9MAGN|nr:hypothetical protein GIB67_038506 [Kingdonia uniflora]
MSSPSTLSSSLLFFIAITLLSIGHTAARRPHIINFKSPNLYPEGLTYDPVSQHFVVGSLHHRSILSVSDAGVVETLIYDPQLPENVTILGLEIDSVNRRLLAVIHAMDHLQPFNALASYDLYSHSRIFLAPLLDDSSVVRPIANDVTVDFKGNAYVTNAAGNFIWKVSSSGDSSIFSRSPAFTKYSIYPNRPYSFCGLNGIAYLSKGYFLVVQSNTGKMFKVDEEDGGARLVLLSRELPAADGIALRSDGIVVVVSQQKAWLLQSTDSWGEAMVYDEIDLEIEKFATSVTIRGDDKAYVVYGHIDEGKLGKAERAEFSIAEIESVKGNEEEVIWVFVLIGLGLAYFMYWRFQMGQLVKSLNKKRA